MPGEPNETVTDTTLVRTSVQLPPWMVEKLDIRARATFASRSQVIRQMVAAQLDHESAEAVA